MILRARGGGDVEMRAHADPTHPANHSTGAWLSYAGVGVTDDKAFGLSAVSSAIRLVAETVAALPLLVFEGRREKKKPRERSWQWELLTRNPSPGVSSRYDFYCDLAVSVEGWGNAFVWKVRQDERIVALLMLDPTRVQVRPSRRDGILSYAYRRGSETVEFNPADILHVRGFRVPGSLVGLSPVQLHRHQLGAAIAIDEYEGDFFRNGAQPGGTISAPTFTMQQAQEFLEKWKSQHEGLGRRHAPAILYGGMQWQQVGVSLEDAQFVEAKKFTVEQIARMWRVPAGLLGAGEQKTTEEESLRFLNFSLLARLCRIEDALLADQDLFPPGTGDLYPEFQVDEFLRADAKSRAEVLHKEVQSGITLVDEARAEMGRPPLPDGAGKVPQITPVGGAPNPALAPASSNGSSGED